MDNKELKYVINPVVETSNMIDIIVNNSEFNSEYLGIKI
jgi:hypothetical protein